MLDIDNLKLQDLDKVLHPVQDDLLSSLKQAWYDEPQKPIAHNDFVDKASNWFKSTKINDLHGWDKFRSVDIIMGCTHFIESLASKHKWNIQILQNEYAYYTVMGKQHTEVGQLDPGKPLIVSLPNYHHGDRPDWENVLKECEQKDIDIHVDCAWVTAAKGFKFNFDHPNIKSFAMSMSKYNFTWNRIGLRWSRQRTMDSCSLISAQRKYNELTTACGSFMMDNIPRDYGWQKYGDLINKICDKLNLKPTMFFYVLKDNNGNLYSIGNVLGKIKL
jgi:hypothetical protein